MSGSTYQKKKRLLSADEGWTKRSFCRICMTQDLRPIPRRSNPKRWIRGSRRSSPVKLKEIDAYTVASDACSKFVGGAERPGWDALLEMEAVNFQCDQSRIGATTLGVDLVKVS